MVTKFTINFLVTFVTSTNMVNVVTSATMATMVAVDTRTRHLFHCHQLLHMEYRVICLCAVFRATS